MTYPNVSTLPSSRLRATPRRWVFSALLGGLVLAFILSLTLGSVNIPLPQIITILFGGLPDVPAWGQIIWLFRLPRALTAMLAGAALSVAGVQMQTLFRNPLADPFVLGISAGASLGVALLVMGGQLAIRSGVGATLLSGLDAPTGLTAVLAASLGALGVMLLVLAVAQRVNVMTLLVLGLMIGYAVSALVSILLHFSAPEQIQVYIAWTFGSFSGTTWEDLKVLLPVVLVGVGLAQFSAKPLNALLLGETYAVSMGLSLGRTRLVILLGASLLAGAITAFCGPIGFLGVAVPHLARLLLNAADHRRLLPASVLLGALVALLADLLAQVPGSAIVLPLNAITALVGAPVVTWVILSQRNLREAFGSA